MIRFFLILLISGFGITAATAQSIDDIELFNTYRLHGTPRFTGMGGAFTALGNDLSSIHLNPAAASVYRRDNFGVSLGMNSISGNHGGFFNGNGNSNATKLNIENAGIVKNWVPSNTNDHKFTFSVSHNKLADFNRQYNVAGVNNIGPYGEGSLADYWLYRQHPDGSIGGAIGFTPDEAWDAGFFEEYAAAQAGVLVTDSLIKDVAFGNGSNATSQMLYNRNEAGNLSETSISFGGARADNFFYGFSVAIPTLAYSNQETILESDLPADAYPYDAKSYNLNRYNDVFASGINVKLGIIYKPYQQLRLAAAYQSPSWYTVSQLYEFSVGANFSDGSNTESSFSTGEYRYALRTPSIFRLGAAYVFGKNGLLSIDYEYSNPSKSHLYNNGSTYGVSDEQLAAEAAVLPLYMKGTSTVRIGGEYRVKKFFLRGGYNFRQSIYEDADNFKSELHSYSGGIGYRAKSFGIDVALAKSKYARQDFVHHFNDLDGNITEKLVDSHMSLSNLIIGANFSF